MGFQDLPQNLINAATATMKKNLLEGADDKYQELVKKTMKQMGIDDLGKASDEKTKELFNKVDKIWNSDEEPGDDGVNTTKTDLNKEQVELSPDELAEIERIVKKNSLNESQPQSRHANKIQKKVENAKSPKQLKAMVQDILKDKKLTPQEQDELDAMAHRRMKYLSNHVPTYD